MSGTLNQGFRAPEILAAALDLAVVYLKNYALDKADALYEAIKPHCLSRGLPWNVKWFQDCATLRPGPELNKLQLASESSSPVVHAYLNVPHRPTRRSRCKQNRQAEAAPMLEEVAKLTPPHEAGPC